MYSMGPPMKGLVNCLVKLRCVCENAGPIGLTRVDSAKGSTRMGEIARGQDGGLRRVGGCELGMGPQVVRTYKMARENGTRKKKHEEHKGPTLGG